MTEHEASGSEPSGASGAALQFLMVCTHNRTRSVVAAALLSDHLGRHGVLHRVTSAGVSASGLPATELASVHLARRGILLGEHRSRKVDSDLVHNAHLVLTAEPEHVVWIAGRWPDVFPRTFTLPEAAALLARAPSRAGRSWTEWMATVASGRQSVRRYLERDAVPGVIDPTGAGPRAWDNMMDELDRWCAMVSVVLAAALATEQKQDSS